MRTPSDDLQRSQLHLIDSDSDDSDVIFLGTQPIPASTAGRISVVTDTHAAGAIVGGLAPGMAEDSQQPADVGDREVQRKGAAGQEDEREEEEEVYVRNPYSRRSISRDGSSLAGRMDPSYGGDSRGDSPQDDDELEFQVRRSPASSTTSPPGRARILGFEGEGRNIRKRPATDEHVTQESDEDLPIRRKAQSGRRKRRIASPSDGGHDPGANTPELSHHATEPLFLPGPASSPTPPTGSPLSQRIKRSRLAKEPSAVPPGASSRLSRSSSSSASSIGQRSTHQARRVKGWKRPYRDPDSSDVPSDVPSDEPSEGSEKVGSNAGDTDSEKETGSADDERTEWDSEDRDDLSSGMDSDAEPETDEDDPILDMNMPETERIIRKRAPDPRPKRKGEGGQVLRPITGAHDLIYTKLPLDPLPAALQHRALDGNDFCALYEPSLDDTDDEGGCNDDSYLTGANGSASRSRVRETDGGLDVAVETDDDEEESRPSQEANGDDALTAALRKRRKQMDAINFQRLCITLAVRYRNGASHSGKALSFLDDAYFNVPWSWLQSKMRYAAGCLERPTWTNVKHDYKDYSELVQDPISFSEHCEGCHRDWQEKCLSYTECTVSGGYDDMTLAPTQRESITIALGTDCRTSFVETFAVYHQVYHSAMGLEKDIFNDERMYPTIKRILRKDVIDIDELVDFLTTCGTPRRTMNTIHRVYSTINRRRHDWWYDKENNAARQREEIRYYEVRTLRLQEQSLPRRIRGHIVGRTYY